MTPGAATSGPAPAPAAYRLFAVMWAFAVAFHVVGNAGLGSPLVQAQLAVGVAATLLWPDHLLPLAVLCTGVLASVWDEAPILGNHWLLGGLVAIALLQSAVTVGDPAAAWPRFAPAARLTVLVFYTFAAFSKLNAGYFDPTVSCAVFYFRQSVESFGIVLDSLPGALERGLIGGTVAIELAIPLLLAWPRTRRWGVVAATAFHFVLALDRTHRFFDFSAVMTALFVLFVPGFADGVARGALQVRARLASWRPGAPRALGGLAALGLGAMVLAGTARGAWAPGALGQVGLVAFWVYATGVLTGLVAHALRGGSEGPDARLRPASAWLLLAPALALLNGLTPYLEIKTAYGWNMYANLRTVGGESNHFLVRATLPLTSAQKDLVRVLASSDPGLRYYADAGYDLTWDRFRDYLSRRPDASVTYRYRGEIVHVARAGAVPGLAVPLPEWRRRLLLHRAVDASGTERCLTGFGPAG